MTEQAAQIQLHWEGPLPWPGIGSEHRSDDLDTSNLGRQSGVYLWTVESAAGFLVYTAGITRRPFRKRFREHTRAYRSGVYTIFDAAYLMRGERKKIWPGFWFRKRAPDIERQYQVRQLEISAAAAKLLSAYRVFVAPVTPVPRVLKRIEAAIMNALYAAGGAVAEIPDRGMALSARWKNEPAILVQNTATVLIHGLPTEFEV